MLYHIPGCLFTTAQPWPVLHTASACFSTSLPAAERPVLHHAWLPHTCRFNEVVLRWTASETWVFERLFNVSASALAQDAVDLLLTGVDTVADIYVNDNLLRSVSNAHRRASELSPLLPSSHACAHTSMPPPATLPGRPCMHALLPRTAPDCLDTLLDDTPILSFPAGHRTRPTVQ